MTRKFKKEVHHCSTLDGDKALHLTQRNGVWYYQRRIPAHSQAFLNAKTIKKSLKTKDKKEASILARSLATEHDLLFMEHEALEAQAIASNSKTDLSSELDFRGKQTRLQKLRDIALSSAKDWVSWHDSQHDTLASNDKCISASDVAYDELEEHMRLSESIREEELSNSDLLQRREWKMFEGCIPERDWSIYNAFDNKTKKELYVLYVARLRGLMPSLLKRFDPYSDNDLNAWLDDSTVSQPQVSQTLPEQVNTLSKCISEYLKHVEQNNVKPKTIDTYQKHLALLLRVLGDRPIYSLVRDDAREFKNKLISLPANINKYGNLSIDEIIALGQEPRSETTVNNILRSLGGFFNWCVIEDKIEKNYFKNLNVKTKIKDSEIRARFNHSDLSALFSVDIYQGKTKGKPHQYWIPLLGLYTGARLNELCQLYIEDIQNEDGIYYININESKEDQSLKNRSSARHVPIHSYLIKLGFLDYVASVKHERLFPELVLRDGQYGKNVSTWFGRERDKVLPNAKRENKVFHSFRHTLIDSLKQTGQETSIIKALVGHSEGSVTLDLYGKGYGIKLLSDVIETLDFDIDIKPMKSTSS